MSMLSLEAKNEIMPAVLELSNLFNTDRNTVCTLIALGALKCETVEQAEFSDQISGSTALEKIEHIGAFAHKYNVERAHISKSEISHV